MTLEALQYLVTDLALKHNLVNCAMSGPSIYAINPEDIKEYPLIFVSPTGTHTIKENTTRYSLTFFYMDRLFEDSSNEEAINSAGIETLRNLKLQLSKIEVVTDIQEDADIRLFTETERMADRVAGAYMTIWIETLNPSTCPAFFDEYGYYMGNYFATEGLENVLDGLASKEWVNRLIASLSVSGITPEEFERIMGKYVLEKNFATINGSKITNKEVFTLVEQGEYSEQVQEILQAISANTQDIQTVENNLTSVTQDIQNITNNVTSITENITVLSGDTTEIENNITNLSASTRQEIENIYRAISAATPDDYEAVKTQVSANTEDIAALSAQTSANTAQIADLSGSTSSAVSSLTQEIETLSQAISGYTPQGYETLQQQVSANTEDIAELSGLTADLSGLTADLSGVTSGLSSDLQALSAYTENISDWVFYTTGYAGPQDVRNSDDLVDFVQSLGSEFAKARIFINESDPNKWLEYHVFRVTGDTIYVWCVYNKNTGYIEVRHGSYTKGVSPSQSDFTYFSINPSAVSSSISNLQVQVASHTNSITYLNGQVTGLTSDLATLSAFTETLTADTSETAYIDLSDGSTGAQVYAKIDSAYTAGKEIILRAIDYTYRTNGTQVLLPFSRKNGSDYYFQGSWVQELGSPNFQQYFVKIKSNGTTEGTSTYDNVIYAYRSVFSRYVLPTASASTKGGIKVGTGLSMNGEVMNADVASSDVHNIVSLTQSAYDALATRDPNTLYIIKPLY